MTASPQASSPQGTMPSLPVLLAYGLGSLGSAIKSAPISAFILVYYNQVMGLPALTVSSVLMATLVLDALLDPVVGQVSDSWRSRLGRRLPLMYGAALPLSVFVVALWNPPGGLSQAALAAYLFACLAAVRLFDTFFELPHLAIVPELVADPHNRTRIYTWRYLFEAAGGILVSALAYNVFMRENPDGTGGILAREGYTGFAWFSGVILLAALLACTRGLHRTAIARSSLDLPPAGSLRTRLRLFIATLNCRPVLLLTAIAIVISVGSGMGSSLSMYWLLYYYRFSQAEMSLLFVWIVLGIGLTALTPKIALRLGKRGAIVLFCWIYFAVTALPLFARYFDLLPASTGLLFSLVALQSAFGAASMTMIMIVLTSMAADLTEEAERRTGQRSEAMLLASISFVRKATQGLGVLGAGAILALVTFPQGAERSEVDVAVMDDMALLYLAGKLVIFLGVTFLVRLYGAQPGRPPGQPPTIKEHS